MPRKTRKQPAVKTIPELRKSFDYMDEFVEHRVKQDVPEAQLVKEVQTEWYRVFSKRLSRPSATAFLQKKRESRPHRASRSRKTARAKLKGGMAPLDYTTRPGWYLEQGSIPTKEGTFKMAGGASPPYGNLVTYLNQGGLNQFWNPEIAMASDPIKGQSTWPSPSPTMGTNEVSPQKGGRRGRTIRRGGGLAGSMLTQAFTRPIPSSSPPTALQRTQADWYGQPFPSSTSSPTYQLGSVYPKSIQM